MVDEQQAAEGPSTSRGAELQAAEHIQQQLLQGGESGSEHAEHESSGYLG